MDIQKQLIELNEQLREVKEDLFRKNELVQSTKKTNTILIEHNELLKKKLKNAPTNENSDYKVKQLEGKIQELLKQMNNKNEMIVKITEEHKESRMRQHNLLYNFQQNRQKVAQISQSFMIQQSNLKNQLDTLNNFIQQVQKKNTTLIDDITTLEEKLKTMQVVIDANRNIINPEILSDKDLSISFVENKNETTLKDNEDDFSDEDSFFNLKPSIGHEKIFNLIHTYFMQIPVKQKRNFAIMMEIYFQNKVEQILNMDADFDDY